jgi:UDP-glucose 4-epimerase
VTKLPEPSSILITGGAGYIGSHASLRLLESGCRVTIMDTLALGHMEAIEALRPHGDLEFVQADCGDQSTVCQLIQERSIDTVMHFAAFCDVNESVHDPLKYYANNTGSSLHLLMAVAAMAVPRFIFSSTCATYGEPGAEHLPITEACPQAPINPYGHSKLLVEEALSATLQAAKHNDRPFAYANLRYFNVAGSDASGRVGEDHDPETHLIPICLKAAMGRRDGVTIFGTDYETPDGTCIRDYVHVSDLIEAHVAVMHALEAGDARAYNVGTGRGVSVREILESVRRVTGVDVAGHDGARREGDPPMLYNDPSKIVAELGWSAKYMEIDDIVATAWDWMQAHPDGWSG